MSPFTNNRPKSPKLPLEHYTRIPNMVLGSFEEGTGKFIPGIMAELGNVELRVYLVLMRFSFGFDRQEAYASLTVLQKATGINNRSSLIKALKKLIARGLVLERPERGPRREKTWGVSIKNMRRGTQVVTASNQNSN